MKFRKLGSADLSVSELSLGCMSLGTDEQDAIQTIHMAIDEGINYFDTADLYDFGKNEELVGKALKGRRDKVILATKVGNRWNESKTSWTRDPSKAYIKEQVKESLRRLGTDYIDLYQLHGGTIEDDFEQVIEAFEELVKEGTVRYYGISSIRPNVIHRFVEHSSIQSNMMQYNLLDRRPEEFFSYLVDHQVSVIVRGAIAKGLLTSNWMNKLSDKGYLLHSKNECIRLISQIESILDENQTLHSLALHYYLSHQAIASLAIGARNPNQLKDNLIHYYKNPIDKHQILSLNQVLPKELYVDHR
ncbi:aldo/keto reductase [Bacillus sp. RG28]|uniref:Aldo/keto reductase n=1 Tax=Gottfriedia endophytica TaxID=2820819 RepID=A0A940NKQ3_9BACI|nr:aldo/keto reductase [Gottfriedia endophytica]MBP0724311.1 aldo/keto reductase [Gottfriedia endophytica]